jgi:hypothetical protein
VTIRLLPPPDALAEVKTREIAPVSPSTQRAAAAVAEALFSSGDGKVDVARLEWVVADLADYMARAPGRARMLLTLGLFVLTWVAPLLVWRFGPLASLDLDLRVRALERIEQTILGPAALAMKAMLCMIWFEHDDTRRETRTEATCLHM